MKKMKKTVIGLLSVAAMAVSLQSCITTQAGTGGLYTDVKQGEMATSNIRGSKVGTAKASCYVGLIAVGDASVDTAAKNGGITRISHVDSHKKSILGIVTSTTTIVYGE